MDTSLPTTLRQLKTIIGRRPPRDVRQRFNRLRDRLLRSGRDHMLTPADVAWVTFGGNNDTSSALRGGIGFKKIVLAALAAMGLVNSGKSQPMITNLEKVHENMPQKSSYSNWILKRVKRKQTGKFTADYTRYDPVKHQDYGFKTQKDKNIGSVKFPNYTVSAKYEQKKSKRLPTKKWYHCVEVQAKANNGEIVPISEWKYKDLEQTIRAGYKYISTMIENPRLLLLEGNQNEFAACFKDKKIYDLTETFNLLLGKTFSLEENDGTGLQIVFETDNSDANVDDTETSTDSNGDEATKTKTSTNTDSNAGTGDKTTETSTNTDSNAGTGDEATEKTNTSTNSTLNYAIIKPIAFLTVATIAIATCIFCSKTQKDEARLEITRQVDDGEIIEADTAHPPRNAIGYVQGDNGRVRFSTRGPYKRRRNSYEEKQQDQNPSKRQQREEKEEEYVNTLERKLEAAEVLLAKAEKRANEAEAALKETQTELFMKAKELEASKESEATSAQKLMEENKHSLELQDAITKLQAKENINEEEKAKLQELLNKQDESVKRAKEYFTQAENDKTQANETIDLLTKQKSKQERQIEELKQQLQQQQKDMDTTDILSSQTQKSNLELAQKNESMRSKLKDLQNNNQNLAEKLSTTQTKLDTAQKQLDTAQKMEELKEQKEKQKQARLKRLKKMLS